MVNTTWTQTAGMTSETGTDNIEDYAEQAEASKDAAAASETASANSAAASASSASGSSTSAAEALASKNAAAASETSAAASAATATTQASNSSTSATASETSKVASVAAQAAAETAETAAETAQTAAEAAEAGVAADAATATAQAAIATTQATNSGTSATASEVSRVASVAAQAAAETAETNAETAETNAETAQTAAETAETNAASSSTSASTSAATATTQAGIATTKAGEAAASATASASSATASEAAKDAALSALDNFQDQYLGDFATDPTTDNDGDPLQAGMLYFNTTDDVMKVYTGSAWVAAYASLSGALLTTNNLSDLNNAATARTNLGLGTAATTAATAYATAAQGALADSAVQPSDSPTFGSVTVTGTVDGRDVAADGTKLDGIEASADVTDTTNVTAAGALMDSEVTNLAQVKAFDSSDYATAAQGTTADNALPKSGGAMTGAITTNSTFDGVDVGARDAVLTSTTTTANAALPKAGGTLTGNLVLGDNVKATFGSSADLQVYHDGSNSYIIDNGTGDLVINTNGNAISLNPNGGGEYGLRVINNGAVNLYHDNSLKAATTASGISVSGSVTVTGTVDGRDVASDGSKLDGIAAGATNVTNNNQLTNGAGYTTYTANQSLNTSSSPTFHTVRSSDWYYNNNSGNGLYNAATGAHFMSEASGQWTFMGADNAMQLRFETNSGTFRGSIYADNSNQIGFLDSDANWAIKHVRDSRTEFLINDTEYMQLDANGLYLYDGSLREDYDALSGTSPTCNVNNGGAFSLSMSGNTTFTFSGATSGMSSGFILQLTGNGSTVTWPSTVRWAGGAAPDAPASGASNLYVFYSRDGGSNWIGVLSSAAYA